MVRGLTQLFVILPASLAYASLGPADPPGVVEPEPVDPTPIPLVKRVFADFPADAALRRTDVGPGIAPTMGSNAPELIYATLGRWVPLTPSNDPYVGNYSSAGGFLRLDLDFLGLLNPPGPVTMTYAPDLYGPNPLFGWVELDLDANENTGGDTVQPEYGYNANTARYGSMPQEARFVDRISTDGLPWDGQFDAVPAIHRSGEEFHLVFEVDDFFPPAIDYLEGNSNGIFEAGEAWVLGGYFFRRATGYDLLTWAAGYEPWVTVRFRHAISRDVTTVSLVYPLNNESHAALYGTPPDGIELDFDASNANSVLEALNDLRLSAEFPPPSTVDHDYRPLLAPWAIQEPLDYLNPWNWRSTMLFGTVLESPPTGGGGVYVWTDIWPNGVRGDFNGDGLVSRSDARMLTDYIAMVDADPRYDADGSLNGEIDLVDYAFRFSIFDHDYDGLVSQADDGLPDQGPCDYDNDTDVDLKDYQAFQACYSETPVDAASLYYVGCLDAFDADADRDIDLPDFGACFFEGPAATTGAVE